MIDIVPSDKRFFQDFGWLQTRWHFSFGDYYDPKNMNFGALRVFNDDVVRGGGGFELHPVLAFRGPERHRRRGFRCVNIAEITANQTRVKHVGAT